MSAFLFAVDVVNDSVSVLFFFRYNFSFTIFLYSIRFELELDEEKKKQKTYVYHLLLSPSRTDGLMMIIIYLIYLLFRMLIG